MPRAKAKTETTVKAAKKKKVSFKFKPQENVHEVKLAGTFSNWDQGAIVMAQGKRGEWKAQVSLKPGEYEYKFLADGNWYNDPAADKQVPNMSGSENSLRIVR